MKILSPSMGSGEMLVSTETRFREASFHRWEDWPSACDASASGLHRRRRLAFLSISRNAKSKRYLSCGLNFQRLIILPSIELTLAAAFSLLVKWGHSWEIWRERFWEWSHTHARPFLIRSSLQLQIAHWIHSSRLQLYQAHLIVDLESLTIIQRTSDSVYESEILFEICLVLFY